MANDTARKLDGHSEDLTNRLPLEAQGAMAGRLSYGVRFDGHHLRGPLQSPAEPWHYSYER